MPNQQPNKDYLIAIQRKLIFADVVLEPEEALDFKTRLYEKLLSETPWVLEDLILAMY